MLRGKNTTLRPVKRSDINYFVKWFNDEEVAQYLDLTFPITKITWEKNIEELLTTRVEAEVWFIIEMDSSGKAIGATDLNTIDRRNASASFAIVIGEKKYWRQGYGTEAARLIIDYGFNQLNLHRISSRIISFNERSIRMHKKLGFREEVRQREAWFKSGIYYDEVLFGLLKSEWQR